MGKSGATKGKAGMLQCWMDPWTGQVFMPMPAGPTMMPTFGKGFGKGCMKGGGKVNEVKGDPACIVYVGGLAWKIDWKALKDLMKQAGTVEFCNVLTEDGTEF